MNIQELRLKLLEKAIEIGVPFGELKNVVDPLVNYVLKGNKTESFSEISENGWYRPIFSQQNCEEIDKKYADTLLNELRKKFGSNKVLSVKVNQNGSLSVFISPHCNAAGLSFYSQYHNFGDWFRGRKISLHTTPLVKP